MTFRPALAAGLVLSAFLAGAALAAPAYVTSTVNLRAGPSTEYPTLLTIAYGSTVDVYGCVSDWSWCDVSAGGARGWVYADYLETDYQGQRVYLPAYAPTIGFTVVNFEFDNYWDHYYRDRPFYHERTRWHRYWTRNHWVAPAHWQQHVRDRARDSDRREARNGGRGDHRGEARNDRRGDNRGDIHTNRPDRKPQNDRQRARQNGKNAVPGVQRERVRKDNRHDRPAVNQHKRTNASQDRQRQRSQATPHKQPKNGGHAVKRNTHQKAGGNNGQGGHKAQQPRRQNQGQQKSRGQQGGKGQQNCRARNNGKCN